MKAFPVFIILVFLACKKEPVETVEVLRPVRYTVVKVGSLGEMKMLTGVSKAGTESKLSFKVAGTIDRIPVKVGDNIRSRQLIATVDASDYELQYEEADAAVKNADAVEKNAKSNYERISQLYENQNASLSEFESAKASFNSAKANEKAAKQRRKLAKSQISYTRLFAPFQGVISEVFIEANENVNAGTPIVVLTSTKGMEVEVSVPDIYITLIEKDMEVGIRFSAIKDKTYRGVVSEVAYAAGFQTTYPVVISVADADDAVRPGMTAEVNFPLIEPVEGQIVIPSVSVSEDLQGKFVYVVNPDSDGSGVINRKEITVGKLGPQGMEILSGLAHGDHVVTAGVSKIKEGMRVKFSPPI